MPEEAAQAMGPVAGRIIAAHAIAAGANRALVMNEAAGGNLARQAAVKPGRVGEVQLGDIGPEGAQNLRKTGAGHAPCVFRGERKHRTIDFAGSAVAVGKRHFVASPLEAAVRLDHHPVDAAGMDAG